MRKQEMNLKAAMEELFVSQRELERNLVFLEEWKAELNKTEKALEGMLELMR